MPPTRRRVASSDGCGGVAGASSSRSNVRVLASKQEPGSDEIDAKGLVAEGAPPTSSSALLSSLLPSLQSNPELLAIVAVYFVQGLLGLSRLALSYFMKDELGLSASEVATLTALGFAPWVVKPLYGFLSDALPLLGYRRKSYLALCGVSGAAAWAAMASPAIVSSSRGVLAATLVAAASTACADVVVDSLVVERSRSGGIGGKSPPSSSSSPSSSPSSPPSPSSNSTVVAGDLQSICWGAAAAGGVASAAASGALVASAGPRAVFAATAFFPLLLVAAAGLIDEERVVEGDDGGRGRSDDGGRGRSDDGGRGRSDDGGRGRSDGTAKGATADGGPPPRLPTSAASKLVAQAKALWRAGSSSAVLAPALFTFVWQATPTPDSALFFYYTDELGLGPEFMGRVRLAGSVASLAGVAAYNAFFKRTRLRSVFAGAAVAGALLSSTQLLLVTGWSRSVGIPDAAFVLADAAVLSALGQAAFMPVLVLAAELCPPGVEASLFAALMSVLNGGSAAGSALGGALTSALGVGRASGAAQGAAGAAADWGNLPLLVLLCSLLSLAPLPLLALVPKDMGASEEGGGGGGGGGGGDGGGKGGAAAEADSTTTAAEKAEAERKATTTTTAAKAKAKTAPSSSRLAVPPLRRSLRSSATRGKKSIGH